MFFSLYLQMYYRGLLNFKNNYDLAQLVNQIVYTDFLAGSHDSTNLQRYGCCSIFLKKMAYVLNTV